MVLGTISSAINASRSLFSEVEYPELHHPEAWFEFSCCSVRFTFMKINGRVFHRGFITVNYFESMYYTRMCVLSMSGALLVVIHRIVSICSKLLVINSLGCFIIY